MKNKEKGDLLEEIIKQLCSSIENSSVIKNAKILGLNTGVDREIDILIEGRQGPFEVKIIVESKNYKKPVGVEIVESLNTKIKDVRGNIGVIVCPNGFTKAAKNAAISYGIQLFEIFDPGLKNSKLLIPLRYIEGEIKNFQFQFQHRTIGPSSLPQDIKRWRFQVKDKLLNAEQLVLHSWNIGDIPQKAGKHRVVFNAMTVFDSHDLKSPQYFEVAINVNVIENFYLKLFPVSFLKNVNNNKENFYLDITAYSKKEDMIKNGWLKFNTIEEMNKAADIENQPRGVRELLIRPNYTIDIEDTNF